MGVAGESMKGSRDSSDAALLRDGFTLGHDVRHHGVTHRIVGRAGIEGEIHPRGNHVDGAGLHLRDADGRDRVEADGARALDGHHHLGGGGERVAAHRHRHGARMAGLARHDGAGARDSVDGRHDSDRVASGFELRTLLDMNFEIAAIARRHRA